MTIPVQLPRASEGMALFTRVSVAAKEVFGQNAVFADVNEGYFPGSVHREYISATILVDFVAPVVEIRARWFGLGHFLGMYRDVTKHENFRIKSDTTFQRGIDHSSVHFRVLRLDGCAWGPVMISLKEGRYTHVRQLFEKFVEHLYQTWSLTST